jgi:glycerophosphoryl diester phosphodiesterase
MAQQPGQGAAQAGSGSGRKLSGWPYPRLAAHRGAGKLAPENTLAALRLGASLGYRMFEFDVKLSSDGVLVLMHDAQVDRTTNASGPLGAMSLAEIAALDAGSWHSPQYAGEGVPTLARVVAWLHANGFAANIEIKPSPGRERETGAAVAREARALWKGVPLAPILSSFSAQTLEAARQEAPELPRAYLMDELEHDWLERCVALESTAVDANHTVLDRGVIERAHAGGLRVMTYTVNDPRRAAQLFDWGLDCLITDAVDLIPPG